MSIKDTSINENELVLEKGSFLLQILNTEKKHSDRTGVDYVVFDAEVIDHPPVEIRNENNEIINTVDINGLEFNGVYFGNIELKNLKQINERLSAMNLPTITEADLTTFDPKIMVNQRIWVQAQTVRTEDVNDKGEKILNPITGKPGFSMKRKVIKIYTSNN